MRRMGMAAFFVCGFAISACDDGGGATRYCDAGFVEGCEDGVYLRCDFTKSQSRGRVVEVEVVARGNVEFVCEGDALVPRGYACRGGKLYQDGLPVEAFCSGGRLYACDGDVVVTGASQCRGNSVLSCDGDKVVEAACGASQSCVAYERGDATYAGCFEKKDIGSGCSGTTFAGSCSAADNVLSFCTTRDPHDRRGKTVKIDCHASGQVCVYVDDKWGYDCAKSCGDESDMALTDRGYCSDDNVLHTCKENGEPLLVECSETSTVCGLDSTTQPGNPYFDCQ